MANKHHPASSATAKKRATRAMRHKERLKVPTKSVKQPRSLKQPTGFARGARVTVSESDDGQ